MTKVDELVFSYQTRATDYRKQNIMIKRKNLMLKPAEQLELAQKLDCMVYTNDSAVIIDFTSHYKAFEKQIRHQYWLSMGLFFLLSLALLMFVPFTIIGALMALVAAIAVFLGQSTQRIFRFLSWWGYTDWK